MAAGFGLLGLIDPVKAQTNITLTGSTLFPNEATSYSNNVLMRFSIGAPVDFLLVGGGGGGGANSSGGGGGGGVVSNSVILTAITNNIVVGSGGAGGSPGLAGTNGGNTTAFGSTAGGGLGATRNGGASGSPQSRTGGTGWTASGGDGAAGGGGGGAGGAGSNGSTSSVGGNGGAGLATTFTGTTNTYAGGGGGGNEYLVGASTPAGLGGSGGGGNGGRGVTFSNDPTKTGANATGFGSGGGGGGSYSGSGGSGSGGIAMVRYVGPALASGGTLTTNNIGGTNYTLHTFTSTGTNTMTFTNFGGMGVKLTSAVRGTGGIQQQGPGVLVLAANSSYSGTTTIDAGAMLQIGDGGTNGSVGAGNVTNNGTLIFNRSDTLNFTNLIVGTGAVRQIGTGTTILTASNNYTGATTVEAGTLRIAVGGSSVSSAILVSSLATAQVDGAAGSVTAQAGGTVQGTGTITNLAMASNSVLKIVTGSVGWNTLGAITFSNGSRVDVTGLVLPQQQTVLVRGTTVTGTPTLQGTSDFVAVNTNNTLTLIPNLIDSDEDGVNDGDEVLAGADPNVGDFAYAGSTLFPGVTTVFTNNALMRIRVGAPVDFLLVGAGGGGGSNSAGGGGGGGILSNAITVTFITNNIVVGAGGAGGSLGSAGSNGGNTTAFGSTAGGGLGATRNGGTSGSPQSRSAGTGWTASGADGAAGGGGGGAGGAGSNGSTNSIGGNGGVGLATTFTGITNTYAGGGGGGNEYLAGASTPAGLGGSGGGGNGGRGVTFSNDPTKTGANATGFGSGGGGGGAYNGLGGSGSGGIAMVRYVGPALASGGTITTNNIGGTNYTLHTFTSTGTNTMTFTNFGGMGVKLTGTINGTRPVQVMGPGVLTLAANNGYVGTTTIDAGAFLQIGDGGTNGTVGAGNVTNNGTLVFNRSDTLTFTNLISGAGAVRQIGSGTTILTASNTYTGATTVEAGGLRIASNATVVSSAVTVFSGATLQVDGAAGSVTAQSGATVQGRGTITNLAVSSNGIVRSLSPSTNAAGAWNTAGPITFSSGAKLDVTGLNLDQLQYFLIQGTSISGTPQLVGATGFIVTNTGTAIQLISTRDSDSDGLTDYNEIAPGTNPNQADTDGDGINDGAEVAAGTDPINTWNLSVTTSGPDQTNNVTIGSTLTVLLNLPVDYLVVGGGGSGGVGKNNNTGGGGGGGAGGLLTGSTNLGGTTLTGTQSIVVGSGGVSADGGNSSAFGIVALGGGAGGNNGGSGGGGLSHSGFVTGAGTGAAGQGNDGAAGANDTVGGGGGGAGSAGQSPSLGGAGGAGMASSITGVSTVYAVGGNGGARNGAVAGANGTANRGNGGGGGGGNSSGAAGAHGSGGSGIVILRYPGNPLGTGGAVTNTNIGGTNYTLHVFTNTGSNNFSMPAFSKKVLGSISGSAGVRYSGPGTVVLASVQNYQGSSVVETGVTIQIGDGGTSGTLGAGNVTNQGTLVFNRADTLNFSNLISGTGAVGQIGTGTTILTASNSYTGATTVEAGTLQIAAGGGVVSSAVTVFNGATLQVDGAAGSVTAQAGAAVQGSGTITNLAVSSNGIVKILAPATDAAGAWNTGGAITFSAGSKIDLTGVSLTQQIYFLVQGSSLSGTPTITGAGNFTRYISNNTVMLVPNQADTDGDGVNDGAEVLAGTDFLIPSSNPLPAILTQPTGATRAWSGTVSFSVGVATNYGPFGYQWRKGETNVTGATSATLSLSSLRVPDSGDYTVVVSNGYGSVTSTVATLVVNKATPSITWTNPAAIITGTALSATQLNATADVEGSFAYTPASGTVLPVGTNTLTAVFTATDTTNYVSPLTNTVSLVVNPVPLTANSDTVNRDGIPGSMTSILIANLLANDSYPGPAAPTVSLPSGTTSQGGTVTIDNGWILYTSSGSLASSSADSFTYQIADGLGRTDTATVTLVAGDYSATAVNIVSAEDVPAPGAGKRVTFAVTPNRTYTIYATSSLGGTVSWTNLGQQTATGTGFLTLTDSAAGSARFYKVEENRP